MLLTCAYPISPISSIINEKYSKKKYLSYKNIIPEKERLFSLKKNNSSKYLSTLTLSRNLYKKNNQKYNPNLSILNYIINCAEKKYSAKTGISASNPDIINYDLTMLNKYEEDLNSSLSYISDFDLEKEKNNDNDNSFNSEFDDDSSENEEIEIKSKNKILINNNKINNKEDENEIKIQLDKDFFEIKDLLLNNNKRKNCE